MANNPLVGAWELVSDSDAGSLIYTGSLCVLVGSPKNRRRSTGNQVTPDEAVEAIRSCTAMAGTYTVSAERIANLRPTAVGVTGVMEFAVEGDTLNLRGISGGLPTEEWTWRMVG